MHNITSENQLKQHFSEVYHLKMPLNLQPKVSVLSVDWFGDISAFNVFKSHCTIKEVGIDSRGLNI